MCDITDFYQYKYCRKSYFINVFISKESAEEIKSLLNTKLKEKNLNREYTCVYKNILNKLNEYNWEKYYVRFKINKCYLQYLKDLYYDFYGKEESYYLKDIICQMQYFMKDESKNIFGFYNLKENTKLNVLSKM